MRNGLFVDVDLSRRTLIPDGTIMYHLVFKCLNVVYAMALLDLDPTKTGLSRQVAHSHFHDVTTAISLGRYNLILRKPVGDGSVGRRRESNSFRSAHSRRAEAPTVDRGRRAGRDADGAPGWTLTSVAGGRAWPRHAPFLVQAERLVHGVTRLRSHRDESPQGSRHRPRRKVAFSIPSHRPSCSTSPRWVRPRATN